MKIKKLYILILMGLCQSSLLLAQDLMVLRTGDEMKVTVMEIGQDEIKYKKLEPQSPLYVIKKDKVFMVKYKNGEKKLFKKTEEPSEAPKTESAPTQPSVKTPDAVPPPLLQTNLVTQPSPQESHAESPIKNFGIGFNTLGFLTFGPYLQADFKMGPRVYLSPHVRWGYAGIGVHAIYKQLNKNIDYKMSSNNWGLGFSIKGFFPFTTTGAFYLGTILDFSTGSQSGFRSYYGTMVPYNGVSSENSIGFPLGYRWSYPSGVFLSAGITPVIINQVRNEWHYVLRADEVNYSKKFKGVGFMIDLIVGFQWD